MLAHSTSPTSWQTFRQTFDPQLSEALSRNLQRSPLNQDAFLQELFGHIKSLAEEGKRVRPYVASLAFEAAGGKTTEQPWDAWIGIELVHLFALIHDDLIDQGTQRHNVETIQTFVERRLQEADRHGDYKRVVESQAMLAGDLACTWALEQLHQAMCKQGCTPQTSSILFQLLQELIVGQSLDVDLTTRGAEPYELIEQKMLLKTARSTFNRPMQLGAALSGTATEEMMSFFQDFGDALGLAFQLQDDWFDVIATEQRTGKTGYRDLERAKQTFFTCFIYKEGTTLQQERMSRLLGYPLNKEQQEEAYTLFKEVDAIKNGERLIEKYFLDAERILDQANFLSEEQRQAFSSLVMSLRTRSA